MKKALSLILAVVMMLGCFVVSVQAEGVDYENVSKWDDSSVTEIGGEGSYLGYHTRVNVPFTSASFRYVTYGDRAGSFDFSLYEWQGTFEDTLKEENLIVKQSITGDGSTDLNYTVPVYFDAQPAGEYLFYLEITSGSPDVYSTKAEVLTGRDEAVDGYVYNNSTTPSQAYMPWLRVWGPESYNGDVFSGTSVPDFEVEVEADHQGVAEGHGLTITNGVGGLSLSYQFKTNAAFRAFSAKLAYLEASKYFDVSITKSGDSEPIQTWSSDGFEGSNSSTVAWVSFDLDEVLPAGEYIVKIAPGSGMSGDILWKMYDVQDAYGSWESVGSFTGEKETAKNTTPCFSVTFTEEVADGNYFGKVVNEEVTLYDGAFNWGYDLGNAGWYDYQFKANAAFNKMSFYLANFGKTGVVCTLNLYEFDISREKTLAGAPVQSWVMEDFGDCTWVSYELNQEVPAGEYIFEFKCGADSCAVLVGYSLAPEGGDPYGIGNYSSPDNLVDKGGISATVPMLKLNFVEIVDSGEYFGQSEAYVPAEPTYPENAYDVETGKTVINAVENSNWFENHLEATGDQAALTVIDCSAGGQMLENIRHNDVITFKVNVKNAGTYALSYDFIWGLDNSFSVSIDNGDAIALAAKGTGDWSTVGTSEAIYYYFTEGEHTIKFTYNWAGNGCHFYTLNLTSQTYVYVNSLDGEQVYSGSVALGELDAAILAKLNRYANDGYNAFVEFKEVSNVDGVHTYVSVHNTAATVTVNGEVAAPVEGGAYYVLEADELDENGVPFFGWYDENAGIYLSYHTGYKFFPDEASENITAVYRRDEKKTAVNVSAVRTEDKLTVTVTPNSANGVVSATYGYYIAASDEDMTADEVIALAKGDSNSKHSVYMVRVYDIQEATKSLDIYLVGYITYVDANGTHTENTTLITVAPDGTVTVA